MAFKLAGMADVLRRAGLTVVEVPGWKTRGYLGQDLTEIRGILHHHTATHRSRFNEDAPTLNMCVNGRSDLPGPLCQIVLGRNGTVYLAAAGVANHAGRGTAPGIPENMGNHYLIGIEMESSGIAPWDWTLDQIRVAPHLGAALERAYLQHLPEDMRLQLGHKEYSYDGKIDPAGWPGDMDGLRASINRILSGTITPQSAPPEPTKEWYEMPIPKSDLDSISKAVWQMPGIEGEKGQKQTMWRTVADLAKESRMNTATINALTKALSVGSGLTEAQITEAVKAAFVDLVRE